MRTEYNYQLSDSAHLQKFLPIQDLRGIFKQKEKFDEKYSNFVVR